jgi:hypothetical protein
MRDLRVKPQDGAVPRDDWSGTLMHSHEPTREAVEREIERREASHKRKTKGRPR